MCTENEKFSEEITPVEVPSNPQENRGLLIDNDNQLNIIDSVIESTKPLINNPEVLKQFLTFANDERGRNFQAEQNQKDREERERIRRYEADEKEKERSFLSGEKEKDRKHEESTTIKIQKGKIFEKIFDWRVLLTFILVFIGIGLSIYLNYSKKYYTYIPEKSKYYSGRTLEDCEKDFINNGFQKIEKKPELEYDNPSNDHIVIKVCIDNNDNYKKNKRVLKDCEVKIYYYEYNKTYLPKDSSDLVGMSINEVRSIFENAKFKNINEKIDTIFVEDSLIGKVSSVTIGDDKVFNSGTIVDINSPVTISYYGKDKKIMPKSALSFKEMNWEKAKAELETAGFSNIEIVPDYTGNRGNKFNVSKLSIDGRIDFKAGDSFLSDSKIVINYYELPENKPTPEGYCYVPYSSEYSKDRNIDEVVKAFKNAGFVSINTEPYPDLIESNEKENCVSSILIGTVTSFSEMDFYSKDIQVTIVYHKVASDEDKISLPSLSYLDGKQYQEWEDSFIKAGFEKVQTVPVKISDYAWYEFGKKYFKKSSENDVVSVTINGKNLNEKIKYPKYAEVKINYFYEEKIPEGYSYFPEDKSKLIEMNYNKVKEKFEKSGFKNIKIEAMKDAKGIFIFGNNNEVESILINGEDKDFTKKDYCPIDSEILIKYHEKSSN